MDQWIEFNKNNVCQKTDIFNFKIANHSFLWTLIAPTYTPLIAVFIKMYFNYLFVTQPSPLGLWVPWGQGF